MTIEKELKPERRMKKCTLLSRGCTRLSDICAHLVKYNRKIIDNLYLTFLPALLLFLGTFSSVQQRNLLP